MFKPLVALLSRQSRFTSELPALLTDRFEFLICESIAEVESQLDVIRPQVFVADFGIVPDGGHREDRLLDELQIRCPEMEIVMITGERCPEPLERRAACTAVTHLRGHVRPDRLAAVLREWAAGPTGRVQDAVSVGSESKQGTDAAVEGISQAFETRTPELKQMLADLEVAAKHDVTILLIGETGSGKTYLSRLIHEVSPRRDKPFLHVACGALPAELIESELFGHAKGAFTSAHANKEGKFVAAGQGTILLDEIDLVGPEQQVKLLRVIETGEFEPVGSNQTLKSQARLVVASNLDLQPLVDQAKFRPDLYYRLNMLKFDIPPLRHRTPDITPLARKFVRQLSERHKVEIKRIDGGFFEALHAYPWPGNVRELENVIQRTVIFCRDGVLTAGQLPPHVIDGTANPTNIPTATLKPQRMAENSLGRQIAMTEQELIEQALFRNNFSRTNTAKQLGISRVTLYNKMKKYGMNK